MQLEAKDKISSYLAAIEELKEQHSNSLSEREKYYWYYKK